MSSTVEIMGEIKALSQHYPRRQLSAADQVRWFEDYANDLSDAGFDATDVRIACANWRTSEEKSMPTPGQLLAYCRKVFRPERVAALIEPPPQRARVSLEERARVKRMLEDLAVDLRRTGNVDFRKLARRPGETEVEQAERLWPSHRVDRV